MVYKRKRSYSAPGASKRRRYVSKRRGVARRYPMRRYRRKSRNMARSNRMVKSVNIKGVGMPRALVMRLPYRYYRSFSTGTNGVSDYEQFRLNSVFDPVAAIGGNQPRFYDEVTAVSGFYNYYTVYRADVSVTVRSQTTSDDLQAWFVVDSVPGAAAAWDPITVFYNGELPKWTVRQLEGTNTGGPLSRTTYKRSVHMADVFGVSKSKLYSDPNYSAPYTGNPSQVASLTVGLADNPGETVGGDPANVEVYITYYVKFWNNLNAPAQSV